MVKTLFRVRKYPESFCTAIRARVVCLPSKQIKQALQRLNSAKKSPGGKIARRAVDMLLKSTAVSPAYRSATAALKPPRRKQAKARDRGSISMCVNKMLHAGCNPFHQLAQGACIPDGNVAASVRGFVRRQIGVTVGTNGIGFCHLFLPLANDQVAFVATGLAFTGTNGQWLTANNTLAVGVNTGTLPTNVSANQLSLGWAAGDDRPAFSARIVAAGFSYRYTGKEIDRAGQVYTYVHPAHNSSGSYYDASGTEVVFDAPTLANFLETHIVETSREDTYVPLLPVSDSELTYSGEEANGLVQLVYPWSQGSNKQPGGFTYTPAGGVATGIPICTIMIVGTAGSSYVLNYGQHSETIGVGVAAYSKLPAESDSVGVNDLIAAYSRFQLSRRREPGIDPVSEFKRSIALVQSDRNSRVNL